MARKPALLLLLLFWAPVVRARTLRFGISLDLTGQCFHCHDALAGLLVWQRVVNERDFLLPDGTQLRVQLDIRNDQGRRETTEENYRALVDVSDFLIGPGPGSRPDVASIARAHNKLLMLWATDISAYGMQPLAKSTMHVEQNSASTLEALSILTVPLQGGKPLQDTGKGKRRRKLSLPFHNRCRQTRARRVRRHRLSHRLSPALRSSSGTSCPKISPDEHTATVRWLQAAQERPPVGLDAQEMHHWFLERDAPASLAARMAELVRPTPAPKRRRRLQKTATDAIFDMTIPRGEWADDLIENVRAEKDAHKFLFVWFRNSGRDNCVAYHERLQQHQSTTWAYLYRLSFENTSMDFRVIKYLKPDVLFICGTQAHLTIVLSAAKAFHVHTNAIVVDRPVGVNVAKALKGVNVNYLLEPLPLPAPLMSRECDVFGSMQGFVDAFQQAYGLVPGFAALQTAAVGVSLTQALRSAKGLDVASVSQWLRTAKAPAHFLGPMAFDSDGMLQSCRPSTRQFLPLPKDDYTPIEQYNHSRITIVVQKEAAKNECTTACGLELRSKISFPAPDWLNKMAEVYPCAKGCKWEGNRCSPCDAGEYRSEQDLQCRPCQDGDYSDTPGTAACLPCPTGGTCSTKGSKPVASRGHFRVEVAFTVFPACDNVCECKKRPRVTSILFEKCQPPSVCAGSGCVGTNQGMLCGQCGDGYSYHGPGMGSRVCRKCPHPFFVLAAGVLVVLVYVGLVLGLSCLGERAAFSSGYVPCTLARAVLHHLHLIGISFEAMHSDSNDAFYGYLLMPIDMLLRPLELIMFDCIVWNTNSDTSTQTLCRVYPYLLPICLCLNMALHFVFWLLSLLRSSTAAAAAHVLEEKRGTERNGPSWKWSIEEKQGDGYDSQARYSSQEDGSMASSTSDTEECRYYSRLYGPGRRFSQLHESFRFRIYCSSWERTSLALTLLLYPVQIRGLTRCIACEKVADEDRLRVDFDVICWSSLHRQLVDYGTITRAVCLFAVPAALVLYLLINVARGFKVIEVRRSCAVLFDGFKESRVFWEVVIIGRTGLLILATSLPSLDERFAAMLGVMISFLVLLFFKQPFLPTYREGVNTFTLLSMISVIVVLITGRISMMDVSSWYTGGVVSASAARVPLALAAQVVHLTVGGFALMLASFSFILKMDYIVQFGASISSWLSAFQSAYQLVRSLHTVEYVPKGDKYFIDVSSLSYLEKFYLARSLTRTVSACIDSGSNFRTWMVEKAIHEAFRRAMQARSAWTRELYSEFGTTTWFIAGLFHVTLRSPDIHFAEEKEQDHGNGVTVDELEIALHDVNEDILVHLPTIFCNPPDVERFDPLLHQHEGDVKRAGTWDPLQEAPEPGQITGTGSADTWSYNTNARVSTRSVEGDDDGLDMMQWFCKESQQYKLETSNAEKCERLEATLRKLEEERQDLQAQLDALAKD